MLPFKARLFNLGFIKEFSSCVILNKNAAINLDAK